MSEGAVKNHHVCSIIDSQVIESQLWVKCDFSHNSGDRHSNPRRELIDRVVRGGVPTLDRSCGGLRACQHPLLSHSDEHQTHVTRRRLQPRRWIIARNDDASIGDDERTVASVGCGLGTQQNNATMTPNRSVSRARMVLGMPLTESAQRDVSTGSTAWPCSMSPSTRA